MPTPNLPARPIILLAALLLASAAGAGDFAPGFADSLDGLDDRAVVKVLFALADRADLPALQARLDDEGAKRPRRHDRIVTELRATAARSQAGFLAVLEARRNAPGGGVLGYTPHWLLNGVVVRAEVAAVRELAVHPDVDRVEPDLVVTPVRPVAGTVVDEPSAVNGGIGLAPGLAVIRADEVWRRIGVTGIGALIGIIDSGVDGDHPALAERWRGNTAAPEYCWLDAAGLGHATPVDEYYHGTHVMGTMAGIAPDDTIGVAHGALWIASNATDQTVAAEFDNDILRSLEWLADPDGNPATADDVPDVVQNSWGVDENQHPGYLDCDSRWWDAMDACEAAGVVLVWSAGNEGPDPASLRSPANRVSSPTNAFSVGSVETADPVTVSYFSSRGPSDCGGPEAIKPEIMAPGNPVYSASPGGGYRYQSGTSMAGPHVAGVAALIRSVAPDLSVAGVKQILMSTAVDIAAPGEDNDSGHGLVDAYAAVLAAMGPTGVLAGTVYALDTGVSPPGATVSTGNQSVPVAPDGSYSIVMREGDSLVTFSGFGYMSESMVVSIAAGTTTQQIAVLAPGPRARLSGTVRGPDGLPVPGAAVEPLLVPLAPVETGPAGDYELYLPVGADYALRASAPSLGSQNRFLTLAGDTVLDFDLPELTREDFETGDFSRLPWHMGGDAGWVIDSTAPYEGAFSARSAMIEDEESSGLTLDVDFAEDDTLSFRARVSSEVGFDVLRFAVDGEILDSWSGDEPWGLHRYAVAAGSHTLDWTYSKDLAGLVGSDAAWIDLVEFPPLGLPPYPAQVVTPPSISLYVAPAGGATTTLSVANAGEGDLDFSVAVLPDEAPPAPGGAPVALGEGGPDAGGYYWRDSDAFGGPAYAWTEIAGVGTLVTPGDEEIDYFELGFAFPFYGTDFGYVYVCTNGFLTFSTSGTTNYTNLPIPSVAVPNALIAAYWDDLSSGTDYGTPIGAIHAWADPADDRFIVQYDGVKQFSTGGYVSFQVHLDASGDILCHYRDIGDAPSYTLGIENGEGTDGLQVAYNTAFLHDETALLFTKTPPPVAWLDVAPRSGTVAPLGAREVQLALDPAGMAEGPHRALVVISGNDPDTPQTVVPVVMNVNALVDAPGDGPPAAFALGAAVPNPFNPATTISFAVPAGGGAIDLRVFDAAGRLVRTLRRDFAPAGLHRVVWNGIDDDGAPAASGVYFTRLLGPGFKATRKMTLVR